MNNITKNILASNQWLKENRPTAKIITLDQVIKRLKKGHFLGTENSKTKKGNAAEASVHFQLNSLSENLVEMVRKGESSLAEILSHLSR